MCWLCSRCRVVVVVLFEFLSLAVILRFPAMLICSSSLSLLICSLWPQLIQRMLYLYDASLAAFCLISLLYFNRVRSFFHWLLLANKVKAEWNIISLLYVRHITEFINIRLIQSFWGLNGGAMHDRGRQDIAQWFEQYASGQERSVAFCERYTWSDSRISFV